MEPVDGCRLQERMLLLVLYFQNVLMLQGKQMLNVKLGDRVVFLMELHACQNKVAHPTQLKIFVKIMVLMANVFGLPLPKVILKGLAEFKYVLMPLQTPKYMLDVLPFKPKLLARHQVLVVSPNLLVHPIKPKQDAFKELMGFASGQYLQYLRQALSLQLL